MLGNLPMLDFSDYAFYGYSNDGTPIYGQGTIPREARPMSVIYSRNPQTGQTSANATVEQVGAALANGDVLVREDGTQFRIQPFMGGILLDSLPINVILSGVWYEGQQEALAPFWESGEIPRPPALWFAMPVNPMPPVLAESGGAGVGTLLLAGVVAFALYKFLKK